jgi:protein SCO1/2
LVLNGLVQALKNLPLTLGTDYQVLTVSIDPREKPSLAFAKSRSYLARLGDLKLPWHFLTGKEDQIRKLTDSAGFHYSRDPVSGEYAHPSGIVIVSPNGKISQYLFGVQFDSKKLQRALEAAGRDKTGNWVEEILLYCFHYDPRQSQRGPLVMKVMRTVGALGALSLFAFLGCLFKPPKERSLT